MSYFSIAKTSAPMDQDEIDCKESLEMTNHIHIAILKLIQLKESQVYGVSCSTVLVYDE